MFVDLCDRGLFFFQHINDRRRTDLEDADDIPHSTAIERHGDDLLFDRRQAPFVSVLEEKNGARTVTIVAPVALRPIGLLALLHHIATLTRGTEHVYKGSRPSPSSGMVVCCPYDIRGSTALKHHQ